MNMPHWTEEGPQASTLPKELQESEKKLEVGEVLFLRKVDCPGCTVNHENIHVSTKVTGYELNRLHVRICIYI